MNKKVLITGANSYIGKSVARWLEKESDNYKITTLDLRTDKWRKEDFSIYDAVFHTVGIAHADVAHVSEKEKQNYYKVNTKLAIETAQKAKNEGVKQFIFMSSIIIYAGCNEKMITQFTNPSPINFYGDSKWQAEQLLQKMMDENFKIVILRAPMIYGQGCRGNYSLLAKLSLSLPIFPEIKNRRSMIYIDNFCQFVKLMIDNEEAGVFFPQNKEYVNTSDMVKMIAKVKGHRIIMLPNMELLIGILMRLPGKYGKMANKAFGSVAYDMSMSLYKEDYCINTLWESIQLTEGKIV